MLISEVVYLCYYPPADCYTRQQIIGSCSISYLIVIGQLKYLGWLIIVVVMLRTYRKVP